MRRIKNLIYVGIFQNKKINVFALKNVLEYGITYIKLLNIVS